LKIGAFLVSDIELSPDKVRIEPISAVDSPMAKELATNKKTKHQAGLLTLELDSSTL
jgi:hypothetical protein